MKYLKVITLILLFVIVFKSKGYSQELYASTLNNDHKNAIYGNIGFVPVWGVINGAYERRILKTGNALLNSLWAKVGGGYWLQVSSGGPHILAGVTALSGTGKNHLEVSLGFVSLYNYSDYKKDLASYQILGNVEPSKSDFVDNYVAGGIGYRFQNPENGFIFRTGVSFPEAIYIGLGFSF
jgi:hypothetical protein